MTGITKPRLCGLLGLTLSAFVSATPLYFQNQNFNVDNGGRFSAYLNNDPTQAIQVFCVDYRNTVAPPEGYNVNIGIPDTMSDIATARYGTTPTAAFSYQTAPNNHAIGSALDRYVLAAWLTTQYDFTPGANVGSQDRGIQNATWNLLDTNNILHTDGAYITWENNAVSWEAGLTQSALMSFESRVRIYTSTDVGLNSDLNNGDSPNRYTTGKQEMIGVVPEPASLGMLGVGLIVLGVLRRRVKS